MAVVFDEEEITIIRDIIETADCLSIGEKEMSFGEHLESIITDINTKNILTLDIIQDYIYQMELMKEFYYSFGFDVAVIDKIVNLLTEIETEKQKLTE